MNKQNPEIIEYYRNYRNKNRDKIRKYQRKWIENNKEKKRESDKKYYYENREKRLKYKREFHLKNKKRFNMYSHINYLERRGIISKKSSCESCNSNENLIKHHPNYSKPLFFITLCRNCHNKLHNIKND